MLLGLVFITVVKVAGFLLLMRFMLQLAGADVSQPLVHATYKSTAITDIFSRILPPLADKRFNLAAVVLGFLLTLVYIAGRGALGHIPVFTNLNLILMASFTFLAAILSFCKLLIFVSIILSWVIMLSQNQSSHLFVIMQMAEPILAPFRQLLNRLLPQLGPIDLSPILAYFAITICQKILAQMLMNSLV